MIVNVPKAGMMLPQSSGKLTPKDRRIARSLNWAPWLASAVATVPLPIIFFIIFVTSATTDAAAFYLLLFFVSLGFGLVVALFLQILFWLYRRTWHAKLRDKLALDGITASEVAWFKSELSSEERKTWRELVESNPLLADAYCETLAARLTATRIATKARREILRIERQINRIRHMRGIDTSSLLNDLGNDRQRLDRVRSEALLRLEAAKARLQTIDAAARRSLTVAQTDIMLRRLASSQEQAPLSLELMTLEHEATGDISTRKSTR